MDVSNLSDGELKSYIAQWIGYQEQRLEKEREARELKKKEDHYKALLLEAYRAQGLEGQVVGGRVVGLSTREKVIVTDRAAYMEYVKENDAWELLEFRPSQFAILERELDGVTVPGTSKVEVYDLFNRKL